METKSRVPVLIFSLFMVKDSIALKPAGGTVVYPETVYIGECRTREDVEVLKQFHQRTHGFVRFEVRTKWRMIVAESE